MSRSSLPMLTPDAPTLHARLSRVRGAAANADTDALLIAPGSDLRYFTGQAGGSFERLTMLVVPAARAPTLVVPKIEAAGYADVPLAELGVELVTWIDGDNPYQLVADRLGKAVRVAVSDFTPALHVLALRDALGDSEQTLAGPIIRKLRMCKDTAEITALRQAAAAIDRVHARIEEWLHPGRTEAEVGADIATAIVEEGHTRPDFIIVGSGPNGASPHHEVSDRVIEQGDVVVVDIGGPVAEGYNSDSTRTYSIGAPRADVTATYAVLLAAQTAAVAAVRPGVTAGQIDATARDIITEAGFGASFLHRTGHGIGLDVHEEPYIIAGNDLPLEVGMTFSVEPGIYQAGRWGARLEDIVVVTATGVETLNNRPRELAVVDS